VIENNANKSNPWCSILALLASLVCTGSGVYFAPLASPAAGEILDCLIAGVFTMLCYALGLLIAGIFFIAAVARGERAWGIRAIAAGLALWPALWVIGSALWQPS